jgi:hypothetical protein
VPGRHALGCNRLERGAGSGSEKTHRRQCNQMRRSEKMGGRGLTGGQEDMPGSTQACVPQPVCCERGQV